MLSKVPVLGRLFRGGDAASSGPVHVLRLHGVISPTRNSGPLGGSGPVLNLESLAADIEKAFKPKDVAAVAC